MATPRVVDGYMRHHRAKYPRKLPTFLDPKVKYWRIQQGKQYRRVIRYTLSKCPWTLEQIATYLNTPQEALLGLTPKVASFRHSRIGNVLMPRMVYLVLCRDLGIKPEIYDPLIKPYKKPTRINYED